MDNKKFLPDCIIEGFGEQLILPGGKAKREIYVLFGGAQHYTIDEICDSPMDFEDLDPSKRYDLVVYLNGLKTRSGRVNKLCLKKCREHEPTLRQIAAQNTD